MSNESRIIVLGAAGQLGQELCRRLASEGRWVAAPQLVPLTRDQLELTNSDAVREELHAVKPTLVINCSAYNLVDMAEEEPDKAFAVNAWVPRTLAEACAELDATLVHFSTDYVFGGQVGRTSPYRESDPAEPISVYGRSKLEGEEAIRRCWPKHIIIRTCGLYGRHGSGGKRTNFVETMLRLASQGKPLRIVADQFCTPSSVADVAKGTVCLLQTSASGLYHLTNSGQCSWFEFAQAIFRLAGVQANVSPVSAAEYGSKAKRPAYSVLTSERVETPRLRPWGEALAAYLAGRP